MGDLSFIAVRLPELIYVGMDDREAFDKIKRPLMDHTEDGGNPVLSKEVTQDGVMVIFQYWLSLEEQEG